MTTKEAIIQNKIYEAMQLRESSDYQDRVRAVALEIEIMNAWLKEQKQEIERSAKQNES